jgi:hypothetical protein
MIPPIPASQETRIAGMSRGTGLHAILWIAFLHNGLLCEAGKNLDLSAHEKKYGTEFLGSYSFLKSTSLKVREIQVLALDLGQRD